MLSCDGEKLIGYENLVLNIFIIMLYNKFEIFSFYKNKGKFYQNFDYSSLLGCCTRLTRYWD